MNRRACHLAKTQLWISVGQVLVLTMLLAAQASSADECRDYRAKIDNLTATPPTFEAVDIATKFTRHTLAAVSRTRKPTGSATVFLPALEAASTARHATGDVFQYVDMIADAGTAAPHIIESAQAASIEAYRSAQTAVHEVTYIVLCILGEEA